MGTGFRGTWVRHRGWAHVPDGRQRMGNERANSGGGTFKKAREPALRCRSRGKSVAAGTGCASQHAESARPPWLRRSAAGGDAVKKGRGVDGAHLGMLLCALPHPGVRLCVRPTVVGGAGFVCVGGRRRDGWKGWMVELAG
eukprot:244685-Chlamydomonas_euryale.AAC.2